jgi:hypothetical protein
MVQWPEDFEADLTHQLKSGEALGELVEGEA